MNHNARAPADPATIWTIGHSTQGLEAFLELLAQHGVQGIADVRRFPGSRRHPQFGEAALRGALAEQGIAYLWLPELGGRRQARADSPNRGWRNPSFRGYADHLGSREFAQGLQRLLAFAKQQPSALMCAERLWWQCHRSLIADVLRLRGIAVIHILDAAHSVVHPYTAPARIIDGQLRYPAEQPGAALQGDLFS
ncbi:MAG: DUF488 family protein [Pseudomonas sp.]